MKRKKLPSLLGTGFGVVVAVSIGTITILQLSLSSIAIAEGPATPTPSLPSKNEPQEENLDIAIGSSPALPPLPSLKNYNGETAFDNSPDITSAILPGQLSKNYDEAQSASSSDNIVEIPASNSSLLSCGASGSLGWTTTSSSYEIIRQCTLNIPQDGWVFISANSSLGRFDGEYEGQFRIGIDSTSGDSNIDRWVNVYDDTSDGTDKSVALSVLKPVSAGTHTFYFLGGRLSGTGNVLLYDPTLTVIYVPSAATLSCGASGNLAWTTISSSYEIIRQCTLNIPQDGWVFISADSSVGKDNGEYEGQFRIGIDSTSGDSNINRWVNIYNDADFGTDESVALSVLKPVSAGIHTFYFLGRRYDGTKIVLLNDPSLTVIYVPSAATLSCGASGSLAWTTTSSSYEIIRQCTLNIPQDGWVFISADSSVGFSGEYEGQFRIGIDSTSGDSNIDRWVNVYDDTGDGTDRSVALSVLKPVSAGIHTFYFLGRRYDGTGTVLLYDPTLTVMTTAMASTPAVYLPIVMKGV